VSAAVLRSLLAAGRCEVGAHLHPWSSPPYREEDLVGRHPSQLPDDLLERQLRELTEAIAADGVATLNIVFHSSELLPGGSPYHRNQGAVDAFFAAFERVVEHIMESMGATSMT